MLQNFAILQNPDVSKMSQTYKCRTGTSTYNNCKVCNAPAHSKPTITSVPYQPK
ncbi:hypothetical protein PGB90_006605 [Kerria lacca]